MNEARALADDVWDGSRALNSVPRSVISSVWRIISFRIWRAARFVLKQERPFRIRAMREGYHQRWHDLIEAEARMLHAAGWRWVDQGGEKEWVMLPRDGTVEPAPQERGVNATAN